MKFIPYLTLSAAVLCFVAVFSCSSNIELPPPPDSISSSSARVWSYCVYPATEECYPGSFSTCLGTGGELRDDCPYSNSSSSSVGGAMYAYCVFEANTECWSSGPYSSCPPGGALSNECPYSSSSSLSSSGGSSSGTSSSSGISSSSQPLSPPLSLAADEFLDTRDNQKYKFEIAPDKRVWMSENLNYSKGGTIGFCYKTGNEKNTLGTPGEDLPGCDKPNGRNYTYSIATDGNRSVDKARGICPEGWHIPNQAEWETIRGTGKMSTSFYVTSGNYDIIDRVWQNRKPPASMGGGFYWFSNAVKSQGIALTQFNGWGGTSTSIELKLEPDAYNLPTDEDVFSVRCIMDEGGKLPCGSSQYNPITEYCVNGINVSNKCGDISWNPALQQCNSGVLTCLANLPSGYVCFENNVYQLTTIGGKIWMVTNLPGTYNWAAAMNLNSSCNSINNGASNNCTVNTPHQGICPEGWHIPTSTEASPLPIQQQPFWTATEAGSDAIYKPASTSGISNLSKSSGGIGVRCVKND